MSPTEELGTDEQLHHRVCEEEDHDQVDNCCHAKGKCEALNATNSQDVKNHCSYEVDRIRNQNGSLGTIPTFIDSGAQRTTITHFISNTLEIHDEGVCCHAY